MKLEENIVQMTAATSSMERNESIKEIHHDLACHHILLSIQEILQFFLT